MSARPKVRVQSAQRKLRFEVGELARFANAALSECCALPAAQSSLLRDLREIVVTLVSDRKMATLHRQFMGIAGPTDVLTFQHGEIVISVETAAENALRFASSLQAEVELYLVHGLLHLLGFDDRTPPQARAMEEAQEHVLKALRTSA